MLLKTLKISPKIIINGSLLLLSLGIFLWYLPHYIPRNFSLFLGVIFAPFLFRIVQKAPSKRFLIPAIFFGLLLFLLRTNTFFYAFWVFLSMYLIENIKGRLNNLPLFLFFVLSFIAQQILNNWSFPIRLKLSELAGKIIYYLGYPIEVIGNMIYLDGQPFSVDPACMGLKMMVTAQLLALVIFAYFEHKNKLVFSIPAITVGMGFIMGLTVLSNFIRLVALIIFQIMPDNPMHDIMGLICLIFYTLLPFYFLLNYLVNQSFFSTPSFKVGAVKNSYIVSLSLFALFFYQGVQSSQPIPNFSQPYPIEKITGFEQSKTKKGMLKLENENTLIYIKPPVSFFRGSHDPRVCWQGSGYEFKHIKVEKLGKTNIYTALLTHPEGQMHTAWWYDNLTDQTIDEWEWRLDGLQNGKGYFLVNVTCLNRIDLLEQVKMLLQ